MAAHIAEIIVVLVIIICVVDGYRRGLLLKLYGLVRFILMVAVTIALTPLVYRMLKFDPGIREAAAVLIALVISVVIMYVLLRLLKIASKIPVIKTINHLGGAVVGLIFGVIAVWAVLVLLASLSDIEWCRNVTRYVRSSPILTYLLHFNPIEFILGKVR